jgi:hypothetical protein
MDWSIIMSEFSGLFDLKTPKDLLNKLQYEYDKLKKSPLDQYIAFNFFVTAEHMLDWLYPDVHKTGDNQERRKKERGKEVTLNICWDIATGAKHFTVLAKGHETVKGLRVQPGAFDPAVFDPAIFQTQSLIIELQGIAEQKLGKSIEVLELARKVLDYWENHECLAVKSSAVTP